jgi:hypothetical protein
MQQWFAGLALTILVSLPAFAQQAPDATNIALNDALKQGYEIKSVDIVSAAESKLVFSNDISQTVVTIEKGSNVAICVIATYNWATAAPDRFTNPAYCKSPTPLH